MTHYISGEFGNDSGTVEFSVDIGHGEYCGNCPLLVDTASGCFCAVFKYKDSDYNFKIRNGKRCYACVQYEKQIKGE